MLKRLAGCFAPPKVSATNRRSVVPAPNITEFEKAKNTLLAFQSA